MLSRLSIRLLWTLVLAGFFNGHSAGERPGGQSQGQS